MNDKSKRTVRTVAWTLLMAVVGGVAVFLLSSAIPPHYSASSVVQITQSDDPTVELSNATLVTNSVAAQYAELINSAPDFAAKMPKSAGASALNASATVLGNQNLVKITSTCTVKALCVQDSTHVATDLQAYVAAEQAENITLKKTQYKSQITRLEKSLRSARKEVIRATRVANQNHATPGSAILVYINSQTDLISSLKAQEAAILNTEAATASESQLRVDIVTLADRAGKTSPRPVPYAAVGFLVVGAMTLIIRRANQGPQPSHA